MKFDVLPLERLHVLTEHASQWTLRHMAEDPGFAIAVVAGAITALSLLAILPLIIAETRKGGRTIEDSEAAVRHFLPF